MSNKKRVGYLSIFFVLGIMVFICFGCNKPMTTESKKTRMKELLKDKYGEEFEVRELYDTGRIEAWCYPVRDLTLVFEADAYSSMDELAEDDYVQAIVEKQLDEELQPSAEEAFGNCFVSTNIALGETKGIVFSVAENITFDTLLEYEKKEGLSNTMYINVFIESTGKDESMIEKEYEFIRKIGSFMHRYGLRDSVLILYWGDSHFINDAKKAIEEFGWSRSASGFSNRENITKIKEGKKRLRVYYKDDIPIDDSLESSNYDEMDFNKYKELKEEVLR